LHKIQFENLKEYFIAHTRAKRARKFYKVVILYPPSETQCQVLLDTRSSELCTEFDMCESSEQV